jgi:hypothetical protein
MYIEPKIQFGDDIFVAGLRGSYYFSRWLSDIIYTGVELDYIYYKGKMSEGSGIASSVYMGVELFTSNALSIQLDIGPVFMLLADKNYDITGNYFNIMGNIGFNFYFGD